MYAFVISFFSLPPFVALRYIGKQIFRRGKELLDVKLGRPHFVCLALRYFCFPASVFSAASLCINLKSRFCADSKKPFLRSAPLPADVSNSWPFWYRVLIFFTAGNNTVTKHGGYSTTIPMRSCKTIICSTNFSLAKKEFLQLAL